MIRNSQDPLWRQVRNAVLERVQSMKPGDTLPTYDRLAVEMGCSLAPVKRAMEELARQGWLSLQRGRPARVHWTGSFTRHLQSQGRRVTTRLYLADFRPLHTGEQAIADTFALSPETPCIICGRVRSSDAQVVALQKTYINPTLFEHPARFFVDHDLTTASLRDIYGQTGVLPVQVHALLSVDLPSNEEIEKLELAPGAPVLRSKQTTLVEWRSRRMTLEVMHASYTRDVQYEVDRIPTFID